jgi:hypothetical protein
VCLKCDHSSWNLKTLETHDLKNHCKPAYRAGFEALRVAMAELEAKEETLNERERILNERENDRKKESRQMKLFNFMTYNLGIILYHFGTFSQ